MKIIILGLTIITSMLSSTAFANEVTCSGAPWAFVIEQQTDYKVGSLIIQNNIVGRMEMIKKSVKTPEYADLKALYQGETSTDSYKLYVFKAKENGSNISFLESKSVLGHEKIIELRCIVQGR